MRFLAKVKRFQGAYTARMVAMFIVRHLGFLGCSTEIHFIFKGEIGVLGRRDMDNFAAIFLNFQKLGKCHDADS